MMHDLKIQALATNGNLSAMHEVVEAVRQSAKASREQIEAASAARRSIQSTLRKPTEMRLQVAQTRFAKLVSLL